MTDPTGKSFLSYRRDRLSDGRKILAAQHDLGIPTWQDLNDLEEGHTDGLLRSVLAQPEIANAVAYLTPEVATSATITRTELPGIVQRVDTNDGFFMVPVAGGGLGYDKVAAVAGSYLGTHDLGNWNVTKVSSDPLTDADASLIARRVLKQRLIAIHSSLASDLALKVGLYTRGTPAFSSGTALAIDWMHRFAGRLAVDQAWRTISCQPFERFTKKSPDTRQAERSNFRDFALCQRQWLLAHHSWQRAAFRPPGFRARRSMAFSVGAWTLLVRPPGSPPEHARQRRMPTTSRC